MAEEAPVVDSKGKKVKPAKIKKEKPPKEKKEKKSSPLLMFLGMFLFFLILIAGAVVLIYFNVGGIKQPIDEFLNFSNFAQEANMSVINDEKKKLDDKEKDLAKRENSLSVGQRELDEKEKALTAREAELKKREDALVTPTPSAGPGAPISSDLKIAISTLNEMEPAVAADILEGMTNQQYLMQIIRNMNKDVRAAILEVMDVTKARQIINSLNTD